MTGELFQTEDFQRTEREIGPHLIGGLIAGVLQRQVHHGVLKCAAHVELQGDVVDTLRVFMEQGSGAKQTN